MKTDQEKLDDVVAAAASLFEAMQAFADVSFDFTIAERAKLARMAENMRTMGALLDRIVAAASELDETRARAKK